MLFYCLKEFLKRFIRLLLFACDISIFFFFHLTMYFVFWNQISEDANTFFLSAFDGDSQKLCNSLQKRAPQSLMKPKPNFVPHGCTNKGQEGSQCVFPVRTQTYFRKYVCRLANTCRRRFLSDKKSEFTKSISHAVADFILV